MKKEQLITKKTGKLKLEKFHISTFEKMESIKGGRVKEENKDSDGGGTIGWPA